MSSIDLTTRARIRTAAVRVIGQQGHGRATVREVAAQADVSPGLVIHHFGSKQGLVSACDDWVVDQLRDEKALMVLGPVPAMRDYIAQHPELADVMAYLVAGLRAGGPVADRIWDRLLAMTLDMLRTASRAGLMQLPDDVESTAALMVAQSVGVMMMGRQLAAALGGESLDDPDVMLRYGTASLDIYSQPLFTPAYAEALRASLADGTQGSAAAGHEPDASQTASQPATKEDQ